MQRAYLPFNLKRGRLSRAERAAYAGPFRGGRRGVMRVFPREILRSRVYLEEVHSNLPRLTDKPAVIVWPDSDPGFGDAELSRWRSLFPAARTVILRDVGQYIDEDAPDDVVAAVRSWWGERIADQA
jgi:haloalkane dehalogenase